MRTFCQIHDDKAHYIFEAEGKPEFAPYIILKDITDLVPKPKEGWAYNRYTDTFTGPIYNNGGRDMASLIVYAYNSKGEFTGEMIAPVNPAEEGSHIMPKDSTTKEPPAEIEGYKRIFKDDFWIQQPLINPIVYTAPAPEVTPIEDDTAGKQMGSASDLIIKANIEETNENDIEKLKASNEELKNVIKTLIDKIGG